MISQYDPRLAILLAGLCEQTYVQYQNGPPPGNNGKITVPQGYTQIASFVAPEIDLSSHPAHLGPLSPIDWQRIRSSAELRARYGGLGDVYFGFALTSVKNNIIALRGTRTDFEWTVDASMPQVPLPFGWYEHHKFELARVHLGFLVLFALLADQVLAAANKFNASLPCFVTGHSLGAALAVLAAPAVDLMTSNKDVRMYNLAGPRVGNPAFADAYGEFVTQSYRVVNLTDVVPFLPPTRIFGWEYAHVGEEWSFLNQSGNVAYNHGLISPNNYAAAVGQQVPTNAPRTYPVTGLGDGRIA
jgi:triacylglycerol lipase